MVSANHHLMTKSGRQTILLLDDDPVILEGLALGLQRQGRTIITCSDLESAQMIVEQVPVTDVVSDVRLTGPFAFEGLDFIGHIRRYSPASRIVLMTGNSSAELQSEARKRGAVAILNKPFEMKDLESTLAETIPEVEELEISEIVRIPLLEEILASDTLTPAFQPIMKLGAGGEATVFGFESLARYQTETMFRNPEILFQYAQRKRRLVELEMACVRKTLQSGAALSPRGLLFINIHPLAFSHPQLQKVIFQSTEEFQIPLDRIVLEITEQSSLEEQPRWENNLNALMAEGVRFAFDDVGIAYSHLMYIQQIRPSFLKISQHFGSSFEEDPTKMKIVRNILSLAEDFGSSVILEGVETEATRDAAHSIGIGYLQGYLFGRPASPAQLLS
jgi:EAL domain-containing protein (putative c-di-GMP-specific phosphodiesterase class I)/ActR/RegA family two-component response regulator